MEAPKKGETWRVEYGLYGPKNRINVLIIENKTEFNPINWRCNSFKCEYKNKEILVHGNCFVNRLTKGTRIFSNPSRPA